VPGVGHGPDDFTAVTPSVTAPDTSTTDCAGTASCGRGQRMQVLARTSSGNKGQTLGKLGLQPHPEAWLSTHIQTPTPALRVGVPGASAITHIGTGASDVLGNADTRANASNKSDIEPPSVSFKPRPMIITT